MDDETRHRIKTRLQTFQQGLWKPTDARWADVVYHYTCLQGFQGIINSRTLWASDILHARDPSEGRYATQIVREAIKNRSDWSFAKILELILCDPPHPDCLFGLGRLWNHYLTSFCASIDSQSQWQNYGCNCTGIAIGIRPNAWRVTNRIAFFQVVYDVSVQQSKFEKICDYASEFYRELRLQPSDHNDFWSTVAIEIMLRTLIRFKAPHFCKEKEWRMLRVTGKNETPKTRRSKDGVQIPYVEVRLDPAALPCVVLGSATTDAEARSAAEVLANAGLAHVPIQRSSITCRAQPPSA
jgi:hypothetical protein